MEFFDVLRDTPLPLFILGAFAVLAIASEIGFALGLFFSRRLRKDSRPGGDVENNVTTITNSALALLALFLGFTFSSALNHFEKNRDAVTTEVAAITAVVHVARLQPQPFAERLQSGLRDYVDIRLQVADLPSGARAARELQARSSQSQKALWDTVAEIAAAAPGAPVLGSLVEAMNGLTRAEQARTEALINVVPTGLFMPVAFFLLFNGVMVGVSLGEGSRRHVILSWGLYFLVALALGIIIDLDRPLKGFINVDQSGMAVLRSQL